MKYLLSLFALCLFTNATLASDMHYPMSRDVQIEAIAFQKPSPVLANDHAYLVYEFYLTNLSYTPIKLLELNVIGKYGVNDSSKVDFNFTGPTLANMMHFIGPANPKTDPQIIEPGMRKIVYVLLKFSAPYQIPNNLIHRLTVEPMMANAKPVVMEEMPLTIDQTPLEVIGAPVTGDGWYVSGGINNSSEGHRGAYRVSGGSTYYAQRYALDLVQAGPDGRIYKGDPTKNESYYCYKQNLYAVADGQVVAVKDGIPDNTPLSGKTAVPIDINTVGGNYVIINTGFNRYAFYAHMIPGSIKVKVGDIVKKGQLLGLLGNSGNSLGPHLHFHIVDGPSFLGANGMPYAFENFSVVPNKATPDGKLLKFELLSKPIPQTNQLMLDETIINFPKYK